MLKQCRRFIADFETTVYEGQKDTLVWASAIAELFDPTDTVIIHQSIEEIFQYLFSLGENAICYFHNLKFDGSFWINFLLSKLRFTNALAINLENGEERWLKENEMPDHTIKYSISDMGQWYTITIKHNNHIIELRDSLKLIPFSVKEIGESFGVSRKKLDMDYSGFRYPGCPITEKEREYIKNDVLVVKEALEHMFESGSDKLTIGSCCLYEFKKQYERDEYKYLFPNLAKSTAPDYTFNTSADEYVRKSYFGGWCYSPKEKRNILYHNGVTLDVNSLYPSMMHSCSGNRYPVGQPRWWKGDIPKQAYENNRFYFIRVRTRFYLKPNKLPFIQIKGDLLYPSREHLKSSDVYQPRTGKYLREYTKNGKIVQAIPELTLTMMDWELIKDHYYLEDTEIISGCYFETKIGIFDEYIDKYAKQKAESKGAKRTEAKLFLNNLYGKMGANTNSSFKVCFIGEDGELKFRTVEAHDKTPGYIPIGSAITSYARCFTIRAAQKNYKYFLYADTDSIHCNCSIKQIKGCRVHKSDLCAWKLEAEWQEAIFARQKTYIEIADGEWTVKCAGMPDKCKYLFRLMAGDTSLGLEEIDNKLWIMEDESPKFKVYNNDKWFLTKELSIEDFKVGLIIPGQLKSKQIDGGTLLCEGDFQMRKSAW